MDPLLAKILGCFALAALLLLTGLFIDPLVRLYDRTRTR